MTAATLLWTCAAHTKARLLQTNLLHQDQITARPNYCKLLHQDQNTADQTTASYCTKTRILQTK